MNQFDFVIKRFSGVAVLCGILLLLLCGCGSSSKGVPEQQAQLLVEELFQERGMQSGSYNSCSINVDHHVNKETHTDDVTIRLTVDYNYATEKTSLPARYTYNKASDLWSVSSKGEWSDSTYTFKENELKGNWHIVQYDDTYDLNIKSISGDAIEVEYSVLLYAARGLLDSYIELNMEGKASCPLNGCFFRIPIELPEGFFMTQGFEKIEPEILVQIDPQLGCNYAHVNGGLHYYSS